VIPFEGFTFSIVVTDVCAFPINVDGTISGTETDYVDESGALTRIFVHEVEQDTYTANGRTLVGTPFTFNEQVLFDSSGNVTHHFARWARREDPASGRKSVHQRWSAGFHAASRR
jgi:hypothetical protein